MNTQTIQSVSQEPARRQDGTESTETPTRVVDFPVDLYESEQALTLVADLPGVAQEQVELELEADELRIVARPPVERRPVVYARRFRITAPIDPAGVSAALEHGVLVVTLPRSERHRLRKVEVKVG